MKLLLTLVLFLAWEARAANALLMCLGTEEKRLHQQKNTGPFYDLNQRMTAEMIQIPDVTITKDEFKTVCQTRRFSESWKLLEFSLRKGKAMFIIPESITGLQRSITEGMIEDYVDASKEILLGFLSQIQMQAPTPDCLMKEVPELHKFYTEIKYLQEDVDMKKIMAGKDEKIFEKLKDWPKALQRCRANLKKKTKSASTAEPKNP
ncbi:MAG: hypothetical protein ACJ76H_11010 [Bacteriovoracaceae bacterium]